MRRIEMCTRCKVTNERPDTVFSTDLGLNLWRCPEQDDSEDRFCTDDIYSLKLHVEYENPMD